MSFQTSRGRKKIQANRIFYVGQSFVTMFDDVTTHALTYHIFMHLTVAVYSSEEMGNEFFLLLFQLCNI